MKNGRKEIQVRSCVPLEQAVGYLQDIAKSLKERRVCVEHADESLVLSPAAHIEVEVSAKQKGDKESISLKIGWVIRPAVEEQAPDLKISSKAPAEKLQPAAAKP